jgi:hypothetical protein
LGFFWRVQICQIARYHLVVVLWRRGRDWNRLSKSASFSNRLQWSFRRHWSKFWGWGQNLRGIKSGRYYNFGYRCRLWLFASNADGRRRLRKIIRGHFNVVDENVGEVHSRRERIRKPHLPVHNELKMMGTRDEIDDCGECIFMFTRTTAVVCNVSVLCNLNIRQMNELAFHMLAQYTSRC